jgi:hypothetical protein
MPGRIHTNWWIFAVAMLCSLLAVSISQTQKAKSDFAEFKAAVAVETQKAELAERTKEQSRQIQANRVANDDLKRQTTRQISADSLDRATDILRDEIANASSASQDSRSSTSTQDAATSIELLGQCAREYSEMAKVADKLSDQVMGLQDFVETASGINESD